jgi:hypothetical protein
MKFLLPLLLFLPMTAWSQAAAERLKQYVDQLRLHPLPAPALKNEPLYRLGMQLFHDKISGVFSVWA